MSTRASFSFPRRAAPLAALSTLVVLGGCAPIRRIYTEPTAGKLARVRVSTDGIVWLVPNNRCVDFTDPRSGLGPVAQGPMFNSSMNEKKLGMPGKIPAGSLASSELRIQAEEPLVLSYGHETSTSTGRITTTYTCKVNFAFTPKPGYDYAAVSQTTPDGRRCGLGVFAVGENGTEFAKYVPIKNQYDKVACEKVANDKLAAEVQRSMESEATSAAQ
jgi:hypothetical protein